MNSENEVKLGAQIIAKNINAILNYVANNPKILDPQILTFLQTLEEDNLLASSSPERTRNLIMLLKKNLMNCVTIDAKSSDVIYDALKANLGFKKIMQVLGSEQGHHRFRVSTTFNCAYGFESSPYIIAPTMACINQNACNTIYDFNNAVYMSSLKFLNELNYEDKTADEAEQLEAVLGALHANNELWLNSVCGTSASTPKKK